MNVLIACEESQAITIEMRKRGHNCFSADLQECSGGHPEWHINGDCLPLLNGNCEFVTQDGVKHRIEGKWDMIIAHPPCTYLTVSGNAHFNIQRFGQKALKRYQDRLDAINFFMQFVFADCEKIAIENPVGIMSGVFKTPTQKIQPYEFGDEARKTTCLWLKNLPCLFPTKIVSMGEISTQGLSVGAGFYHLKDENGKSIPFDDPRTAKIRSKTFPGIAKAIAEQWG